MNNNKKSSLLVVGSLGYDSVVTPSGSVENVLGGSANYFSMAASLYAKINVVGVVGTDYNPDDIGLLRERDINVEGITVEDGATFRWSGSYVDDLNEAVTLRTDLNVFKNFNPILPDAYCTSDFVFLANIDPDLQFKVLDQVKSPKVIGLDTMNYWIDSKPIELKKVFERINILLLNELEAVKITGERNIVLATQKLVSMGPSTVIVKRGEYGFFMLNKEKFFVLPAFPVANVVDPTGAGDSFAGGFFGYLSRCDNPFDFRSQQEACLHGLVVASYNIQDFSLKSLVQLNMSQIESRLREYSSIISLA